MDVNPRHQCLIYEGSPSKMLPVIAAQLKQKLDEKMRCIYLNSPAMVAGIKSYLYAVGVDVSSAMENSSLILSSESHAKNGTFDVESMLLALREGVTSALADGYNGLWATGDMTWELGGDASKGTLTEYERQLEELFIEQPALSGMCQYHVDTLSRENVYTGLTAHPGLFINDTFSRINPYYAPLVTQTGETAFNAELDKAIHHICSQSDKNNLL